MSAVLWKQWYNLILTSSQGSRTKFSAVCAHVPKPGVPLSKIDQFRELLEENAYRLGTGVDDRVICDQTPLILCDEQDPDPEENKDRNNKSGCCCDL